MSGCRTSWPFAPERVESLPSPVEMKQYRQAVSAYKKKAYFEAAESFEAIRTQTRDKRFALTALYGLALSKLMAANTPEEYNDAILLWQHWVENVPAEFDYEDPVLAGALIQEKMLFSNIPLSSEQVKEKAPKQPGKPEQMVSRWLLIKSKLELDRLREELAISKKALNKSQKEIQARDKEIGELKRRFEALETIDQKIQKKKNAIPSADTSTHGD
ncbi:MAG: hypothetical protein PVJ19_12095 [Desulfobacteraceae bacterium]